MASLVGVIFSLACLVLGLRGLIQGDRTIRRGGQNRRRSYSGSSATLTGSRALLFNLTTIVSGVAIGGAWLTLAQNGDPSKLESGMWGIQVICLAALTVVGLLCVMWEKQVGVKAPPR